VPVTGVVLQRFMLVQYQHRIRLELATLHRTLPAATENFTLDGNNAIPHFFSPTFHSSCPSLRLPVHLPFRLSFRILYLDKYSYGLCGTLQASQRVQTQSGRKSLTNFEVEITRGQV